MRWTCNTKMARASCSSADATRPAITESKAIALYSPRREDFEMRRIEPHGSKVSCVKLMRPTGAEVRPRLVSRQTTQAFLPRALIDGVA